MRRRHVLYGFTGLAALAALTAAAEPEPTTRFRFADVDPTALGLWEGDQPVLVYNHGVRTKEGVPKDRQRSTYVHPLYGPDGEVLTDDFPRDHYHHRGLFWAWPHVRIAGKEYDLWMLKGIRQQFERWTGRKAERGTAVLGALNGWYVGERRVLREEVRLTVAATTAEGRTIDVALTLTALDDPVTLWGAEGKGYGGLSIRFAPRRGTAITTAAGRQKKDLDLLRLRWADLTAEFAGARSASGVTVLVHPEHPGLPPDLDHARLRLPGRRLARDHARHAPTRPPDHLPVPTVDPPRHRRRRAAAPRLRGHQAPVSRRKEL